MKIAQYVCFVSQEKGIIFYKIFNMIFPDLRKVSSKQKASNINLLNSSKGKLSNINKGDSHSRILVQSKLSDNLTEQYK